MEYREGCVERHDSEVDDARWFPIEEAVGCLTYKGEKELLRRAKEMIEKLSSKGDLSL